MVIWLALLPWIKVHYSVEQFYVHIFASYIFVGLSTTFTPYLRPVKKTLLRPHFRNMSMVVRKAPDVPTSYLFLYVILLQTNASVILG